MRLRVLLAPIAVTTAVAAAMIGAGGSPALPCDGCGNGFTALQNDIVSIVPVSQQTSFLTRVGLAQRFLFPPNPAHPPSPCNSAAVLDSIGFSTEGLATAGVITPEGSLTLIGDVTGLNDGIISAYPPSPCFSAITFRTTGT